MSKSRPESIVDPNEIIKQYGTDALRMGLIMGVAPGQDMNWSRGRIEASETSATSCGTLLALLLINWATLSQARQNQKVWLTSG